MGPKSHENHPVAFSWPFSVLFAYELADGCHPVPRHVVEASVTEVRMLLPDDCLCTRSMMRYEAVERLDHVIVADIPGARTTADHRPVVALGVQSGQRVLLGVEVRVTPVGRESLRPP